MNHGTQSENIERKPQLTEECYCVAAQRPEFDCALVEWGPKDPRAFQSAMLRKLEVALKQDWWEDRDGNICLPDLVICPAEALWMVRSLNKCLRSTKS
jgi:hypothetical protein